MIRTLFLGILAALFAASAIADDRGPASAHAEADNSARPVDDSEKHEDILQREISEALAILDDAAGRVQQINRQPAIIDEPTMNPGMLRN